jgi:transcriptional regulator with XRE-family HTH domain
MNQTTQVATELRTELAKRHMSQTDLATRINVSKHYLSRRVCGHVPFNVDELQQIAEILDVPVEQFLRGAA